MYKTIPPLFLLRFTFFAVLFIGGIEFTFAQNIDFGKSYINVTKGLNGGTVETGDILEIRATFVVRAGTFDSCRFQGSVPAGTTYVPGTVRVLTNEGKIYKQFTDIAGDDPGWITAGNVTINLGYNAAAAPATAFRRGRVANTHRPSFYGSACIMVASFRVVVTAVTGTNISTGGGNMTYKNGINPIQTFTFPSNTVQVYPNYGICSNTVGTNAIGTESNGTFGSGKDRNRGVSANVPIGYTYNFFDVNSPQDYFYGTPNNTSTRQNYTTSDAWAKPDATAPTHRVFQLWDIIGDHTGAASLTAGNPPADTVANANAGYMLVINAAYRIDSAFQQTISNLCPNTYYEVSCWMRNICSKCGCDSAGRGASSAGYLPTAPGDSSGVYPNLTFEIDGIDYYTTGNILYTGQWIKKGFTFLTGPAQTSFTLKFFNNAPGGGGNDWALDDISISTCSPNMKYSPSLNPIVCDSNIITITDTVRSFFNNYVYYKWQRSTDGGATWTDVTAPSGPAVPYWNAALSVWEYVTSYTVPPSQTTIFNNGDKYRVVVATTLGNLSNASCQFTDGSSIITLRVIQCGIILSTQLISFTGQNINNQAFLKWSTATENEALLFDIEKSTNGFDFSVIATVNSHNDPASGENIYSFTDPELLTGKTYYRVKMRNLAGETSYTRTIQLATSSNSFFFISVINPFRDILQFDVATDQGGMTHATLIDQSGKIIIKKAFATAPGINRLTLDNTEKLATGMYFLRLQKAGVIIQKSVVKVSR